LDWKFAAVRAQIQAVPRDARRRRIENLVAVALRKAIKLLLSGQVSLSH
jgi:hypothetical protein